MKKYFFIFLISLFSVYTSAQYTVSGGIGQPYSYTEDLGGTGIENIYILNTLTGATITYPSSAVSVKFYRYKLSLADKEIIPDSEIATSSSGGVTTYTISALRDSYGYLAEENGGLRSAIWIIDYTMHQPILSSIATIEEEDKCTFLKLLVSKSDELSFYANNGLKKDIRRRYIISYENKVWNKDKPGFEVKETILPEQEIGTEILIDAPLMDTKFKLSGDQIARHFNIAKEITSAEYSTIAVEGHIVAEQEKRDVPNEKKEVNENLGGSAPVTINLSGYGNEPVTEHYRWRIYNKRDMQNPVISRTDRDTQYTFEQAGDYLVRLEVAEANSICINTDSISVNISESFLDVPNYFSPGDSPGSNDEFRVAYKSLVKFKCTIFNRWGTKLYEWNDPAKGWDGKHKGNYVNTGVYFYVIEAEGSDGIKYKKGGDINIFRSR